ncbi:zn-dependent hydrolases of the beta-lactamase [Stemphylium lycopersici]|uniref:Zn-dependent hydrolases of the beta-lactamase n=1 Tax=Stemphylium lycopersici TaxID=183478 RepID=A0A364N0W1_STELY|nr:zn-dependent hydrolases of the beta-lactamase [Stemphylium lycopersici]RAR08976.1 zn-dependent hydrolases of the beta-lactamase [Stemphylium lycopersici]RAR09890.1 zn-dependent hydrolases of the beta-lactamase [Stemphylium lycopersici]
MDQSPHTDAILLSNENHLDNLGELGRQILDGSHIVATKDGVKNLALRPSFLGFGDWRKEDVRIAGTTFHITATRCKHLPGHECVDFIFSAKGSGAAPEGQPNAVHFTEETVYIPELAKMAENALQITMDGPQAARALRNIKADVLVPMHYESWYDFNQQDEGLKGEFKQEGILEKIRWLEP